MAIPKIAPYSLDAALSPITNRVDWCIDASKAVLLVHDMQNYFVDFYDTTKDPIKSVVPNIQTLIKQCEHHNIPVVYTAQPPKQSSQDRALLTDFWGPGLSDAGYSTEILDSITPSPQATCYTKWRYSAFQRTPLEKMMKENGKDQLIICGVYAHIGILATSLEAFMRDIKTFVIEDAIADFSPEDHVMARRYISGRSGMVTNLTNTLLQIQASSPTQQSTNTTKNNDQVPKTHDSARLFTAEFLHQQIAQSLHLEHDDFDKDDNLLEAGLDSIRLVALMEQWRAHGVDVDFIELAEAATVNHWSQLLTAKFCEAA